MQKINKFIENLAYESRDSFLTAMCVAMAVVTIFGLFLMLIDIYPIVGIPLFIFIVIGRIIYAGLKGGYR